jgi:hypothetical protein
MKLAEALIERADLKKQIEQIIKRMKDDARIQEGDSPTEDINDLLSVYEFMSEKLEGLIVRINKTNGETKLDDISLADAIAKRDCLKTRIAAYRAVREAALAKPDRYSRNEIKYVRTVDIAKLQRIVDDYSKKYRELDTRIQERNWLVKLL